MRVLHLVDDTTAGGVMRVIDHLLRGRGTGQGVTHHLQVLTRGRLLPARLEADVIVSHLRLGWRQLPMLALMRARQRRLPMVHVEHHHTAAFVAENMRHGARFRAMLHQCYALFDRVVAVSGPQAQWLVRSGAVRAEAIATIRPCVDLSAFRALPVRPPAPDQPVPGAPRLVIGAIGRLDRQKGFDILIAAFRRLPDPGLALHVYGLGPEQAALRQLAGGDPRIRFMGFADPVAAQSAVDVVAMPSRWEPYGLVAVETLAAGRTLLINPVDGLSDHIPLGARPVAAPDVDGWHAALATLEGTGTPRAGDDAPRGHALDLRPGPAHLEAAFNAGWRRLLAEVAKARSEKYLT
ncbi:glycosyltransferase family 4 protein [Pseudooceanicola aestuarii]|uniref:glycosyltransferase family 4 protein n=1 Tax=Pseudooceanicola aestuarii TaxID=2697319 RepID=UPI0013D1AF4D|nr:glycosyltransferase family 4 protein [Pseudooceanicola aestuarii]